MYYKALSHILPDCHGNCQLHGDRQAIPAISTNLLFDVRMENPPIGAPQRIIASSI
jgi:hypothetical protein